MKDLKKYLKYFVAACLLLLVFGSGWFIRDMGAQSDLTSLIKDHEISLGEIKVSKIKNTTLVKALADSEANREVLLDNLASVRDKPAQIKYITRVETVVVGGETQVVRELPPSHVFKLENGLPVAEVRVVQEDIHLDVADLTLRADIVIGERDSAISLRVESDLDPGTQYEIPVQELNVQHIREQALFEPHILIGAAAGVTERAQLRVGPTISGSFFHPRSHIDLVSLRLGTSSTRSGTTFAIGLDPVLYNVGKHVPVFTNLWVGAGATVDTTAQVSGTLSIGAKL
jgi:hypothetical protein